MLTCPDGVSARLRERIETWCGVALPASKTYLLEARLVGLLVECGCTDFVTFEAYLNRHDDAKLRDRIIDAITTQETLWFRDGHPFETLRAFILPALAERLATNRLPKVRLWSAACSTGQEPASIAMCIHEYARRDRRLDPNRVEIVATDISPSALWIARQGRYDRIAMSRGLSEERQQTWFSAVDGAWQLDPRILRMIRFQQANLLDLPTTLGAFDVIFARNVAIYFRPERKRSLFDQLSRQLRRPGWLVLGASESPLHLDLPLRAVQPGPGVVYERMAA